MFDRDRACELCAADGPNQTEYVLVEWLRPSTGHPFDSIHRCRDRAACRDRVEAEGLEWPILDGQRQGVSS